MMLKTKHSKVFVMLILPDLTKSQLILNKEMLNFKQLLINSNQFTIKKSDKELQRLLKEIFFKLKLMKQHQRELKKMKNSKPKEMNFLSFQVFQLKLEDFSQIIYKHQLSYKKDKMKLLISHHKFSLKLHPLLIVLLTKQDK